MTVQSRGSVASIFGLQWKDPPLGRPPEVVSSLDSALARSRAAPHAPRPTDCAAVHACPFGWYGHERHWQSGFDGQRELPVLSRLERRHGQGVRPSYRQPNQISQAYVMSLISH